jgi:hypothetical protein
LVPYDQPGVSPDFVFWLLYSGFSVCAAILEVRAVKKKLFDSRSLVREIARERVGAVPPSKVIVPKPARKKPKHKKPIQPDSADE